MRLSSQCAPWRVQTSAVLCCLSGCRANIGFICLSGSSAHQIALFRRCHNLPASPVEEANPLPVTDPVATSYVDLFQGVGLLQRYPHTITLQEASTPHVVASPRRVLYPLMTKVKDELDRMLTSRKSWSQRNVSVLCTRAEERWEVRICVDFTELNQCVQRERFQLPVAEDLFAKMHGARYFTTLDAASGFWQIPLSPDCSSLTTFITPFRRYRFTLLPFGITSGPEVFHRIKTMLHDIEGTDCFIDDIVIGGATPDEHDQRLRQILDRCRENGLKLNQSNCFFRRTEVKYFGHILTGQGIRADVNKLRAVVSMQTPHNREELQRYMGMIAYLAKFPGLGPPCKRFSGMTPHGCGPQLKRRLNIRNRRWLPLHPF